MMCLDRYIAVSLLKGWSLVLVIMLAVFSLFVFVVELDHVDNRYRILNALRYVVLTLPQRGLDLSPAIFLLGTLVALAALARHNELIGMLAAGVTFTRLVRCVAVPAILLVTLLVLFSEYVSAPLYQLAETQRSSIRGDSADSLDGKGLWSKNGLRFINVREVRLGRIPTGIDLYEFKPDGALKTAIHADHADLAPGSRQWTLVDVQYKEWTDGHENSRHLEKLDLGPFWLSKELPALSISTAGMSLAGLHEYIRYLSDTGQAAGPYELAFWQKASIPLTAGMMVMLAVPIGAEVRPLRGATFGRRMATGAMIGILFYLGTQIIQAGGMLLGLDAALIALTPVLILLFTGGFLFSRMRW
jgi:lipopolysaccharide export system permease protein